jgi:hypothetical protein
MTQTIGNYLMHQTNMTMMFVKTMMKDSTYMTNTTTRKKFLRCIDDTDEKYRFLQAATSWNGSWNINGKHIKVVLPHHIKNPTWNAFTRVRQFNNSLFGYKQPQKVYYIQGDKAYQIFCLPMEWHANRSMYRFQEKNINELTKMIATYRDVIKILGTNKVEGIKCESHVVKALKEFPDIGWVERKIKERRIIVKDLNAAYKHAYTFWINEQKSLGKALASIK